MGMISQTSRKRTGIVNKGGRFMNRRPYEQNPFVFGRRNASPTKNAKLVGEGSPLPFL